MTIFCFILFFGSGLVRAQKLLPGQWRTYTSMREAKDVAATRDSNAVWVATTGGAFRYDLTSGAIKALRNTDGLSDNNLSAVATDANGNVYLGGRSGSFDIYSEGTDRIEQQRGILDKKSLTQKTINHIAISDGKAYLATEYGLTIFNTSGRYFEETVLAF